MVLDYFKAGVSNCDVSLNWKASIEINVDHYEIEYSLDGSSYLTIKNITPKGQGYPYSFTYTPNDMRSYYRLKTIDVDGEISYSDIITVNTNCYNGQVKITPNPVTDNLFINWGNVKPTEVCIIDCCGRILKKIDNQAPTSINVSDLLKGLY